jgi:hypothetical protein
VRKTLIACECAIVADEIKIEKCGRRNEQNINEKIMKNNKLVTKVSWNCIGGGNP